MFTQRPYPAGKLFSTLRSVTRPMWWEQPILLNQEIHSHQTKSQTPPDPSTLCPKKREFSGHLPPPSPRCHNQFITSRPQHGTLIQLLYLDNPGNTSKAGEKKQRSGGGRGGVEEVTSHDLATSGIYDVVEGLWTLVSGHRSLT